MVSESRDSHDDREYLVMDDTVLLDWDKAPKLSEEEWEQVNRRIEARKRGVDGPR